MGLNHLPSGRFAANAAWLLQVMAHNIARWTARIGLGEQVVTTKTLRRRFFSLRSARRLTLHLPQRWPWEAQFEDSLPDGGGGNRPPSGQPNVPANSRQECLLLRLSRPDQHSQTVTKSPRGLKTGTGPPLPQIVPGPSPSLAPIAFRCS